MRRTWRGSHTTAGVNKMLMSDHNTLAKTDNTLSWLCRNEARALPRHASRHEARHVSHMTAD